MVHFYPDHMRSSIGLDIIHEEHNSDKKLIGVMEFEELHEQSNIHFRAPTFSFDFRELQHFMDELWRCGVRPSEQRDGNLITEVRKEHVADLRNSSEFNQAIIGHLLGAVLPIQKETKANMADLFQAIQTAKTDQKQDRDNSSGS